MPCTSAFDADNAEVPSDKKNLVSKVQMDSCGFTVGKKIKIKKIRDGEIRITQIDSFGYTL